MVERRFSPQTIYRMIKIPTKSARSSKERVSYRFNSTSTSICFCKKQSLKISSQIVSHLLWECVCKYIYSMFLFNNVLSWLLLMYNMYFLSSKTSSQRSAYIFVCQDSIEAASCRHFVHCRVMLGDHFRLKIFVVLPYKLEQFALKVHGLVNSW